MAALFNTAAVFSESRAAQVASEQTRRSLQDFPNETVVTWGDTFPFEDAYPVLKQSGSAMMYQLYGVGVFTLAPFLRAYMEQVSGRGVVDRLVSKNGIPIVASNGVFEVLATYCRERLGGVLQELSNRQYGQVNVSRRRCEITVAQ